jgi:Acetyltransferase (GNAT) family
LVACFRRCYGETYPNDDFYDVPRLTQRIESGSLRSAIAIADDGTLVGHTGLTIRHPGANAIEAGNTVVDPACRGQGLLGQLAALLNRLCVEAGYLAYLHYPTAAHDIMQKASVRGGFETGVMLDYVPAETDYRAIDRAEGRVAATVVYQPFARAPQRSVWMAARYLDVARQLYDAASLDRSLQIANDSTTAQNTRVAASFNARRGLHHVHVATIGNDFAHAIAAASNAEAAVSHVDLCLDDPGIGGAVAALRTQQYFFCALLPEFAHTDVLRMQRLASPTANSFAPKLANRGAIELLARMRREYAGTATVF